MELFSNRITLEIYANKTIEFQEDKVEGSSCNVQYETKSVFPFTYFKVLMDTFIGLTN